MDFIFHWTVPGCGPSRSVYGGIAITGGMGRFEANCSVAKPAGAKGTKAARSRGSVAAPAIGTAHMAVVPRIQHRRGKLDDPRHGARAGIADRAPHLDYQPRDAAELPPVGHGPGLFHAAGICGRYRKAL